MSKRLQPKIVTSRPIFFGNNRLEIMLIDQLLKVFRG